MNPRALRDHKNVLKTLQHIPTFQSIKRGKLPKPFHAVGGSRLFATSLIDVSTEHRILLMYRDGQLLTDSAFYAYFMLRTAEGLYPLFHFHWHPSHKGFHCKIPCHAKIDYTNRMLPGAPELALKTKPHLDPRKESDRLRLIHIFCEACGIGLDNPSNGQASLWGRR